MLKLVVDNTKPAARWHGGLDTTFAIGDLVQIDIAQDIITGVIVAIIPRPGDQPVFHVKVPGGAFEVDRDMIVNNITAQMREGGEV